MDKNNKKIIWLGFAISLFFFLIFVFTKDIGQDTSSISSSSPATTQKEERTEAFLEIEGKKLGMKIEEKESVYDFMFKLKKEGKIDFKDKTYSGMGKLIEEINGISNGDKYWIYYVNGQKANIGISNYKIKAGDVVSWKYEKNTN